MRIDRHITGGTGQRLPLAIWNMLFSLGISILLSHAKVNHMNNVGRLCTRLAYQKIIGLDITVDEVFFMNSLHSRQLRKRLVILSYV